MADHHGDPAPGGLKRIGKTLRGYDRKAVEELLDQKDDELEHLRDALNETEQQLEAARSERTAFVRSLEVAAKAADELLEDAAIDAEAIRQEAAEEAEAVKAEANEAAEAVQSEASLAASEIVAVARADVAEFEAAEVARIESAAAEAAEISRQVHDDQEALGRYQQELSVYLQQLGEYLISASADPRVALPIGEQPALLAGKTEASDDPGSAAVGDEIIDLADGSSPAGTTRRIVQPDAVVVESQEIDPKAGQFDEFFSDEVDHDKARDWILKD